MWTSRKQLLAVRSALSREHDGLDKVFVLDIEGGEGLPMSAELKGKTLVDIPMRNVTLTYPLLRPSCQMFLRGTVDLMHMHRL